MSKKNKNGVDTTKKTSSTKKLTKKDLELLISSQEDKHLRLKAEFDNYRKRKDSEISSLLKYEGKSFIMDFLSIRGGVPVFNLPIENFKDWMVSASLIEGLSPTLPADLVFEPILICPLKNVPVVKINLLHLILLPFCVVNPLI